MKYAVVKVEPYVVTEEFTNSFVKAMELCDWYKNRELKIGNYSKYRIYSLTDGRWYTNYGEPFKGDGSD